MSDFKALMAEAASMTMDELDSRQKEFQSEADFLAEMLKIRKKLGDRTSEQLRRKARREEKSIGKKNTNKPRTAVPAKPSVTEESDSLPPFAELIGSSSNERSE